MGRTCYIWRVLTKIPGIWQAVNDHYCYFHNQHVIRLGSGVGCAVWGFADIPVARLGEQLESLVGLLAVFTMNAIRYLHGYCTNWVNPVWIHHVIFHISTVTVELWVSCDVYSTVFPRHDISSLLLKVLPNFSEGISFFPIFHTKSIPRYIKAFYSFVVSRSKWTTSNSFIL